MFLYISVLVRRGLFRKASLWYSYNNVLTADLFASVGSVMASTHVSRVCFSIAMRTPESASPNQELKMQVRDTHPWFEH